MKLLADASLPYVSELFKPAFDITFFHDNHTVATLLKDHDILLCRSTLKVNHALIKQAKLKVVATASSGTDHINQQDLQRFNITLLDAKGCNARAVADYVLACFAYLSQQHAFKTKTVGIIGAGHVGCMVGSYFKTLGLKVYYYDPIRAYHDPSFENTSFEQILACEMICVHPNLHNDAFFPSRNLLNLSALQQLKPNTALINASRGHVVCESALLALKTPLFYCTDVFANEPYILDDIVKYATLCTPHIAGHTWQAKFNAQALLSQKLHALYNLTAPNFSPVYPIKPINTDALSQNNVLACYHPLLETNILKAAADLKTAFIGLRQSHKRHDLERYFNKPLAKVFTEAEPP